MSKLRVQSFALSLDGYGAGPRQDQDNPPGVGGTQLHKWFFPTRTFKRMHPPQLVAEFGGQEEGTTGVDDDFARPSSQDPLG